jgi:Putative Actinobacterial Holin-X, holin superfamily III
MLARFLALFGFDLHRQIRLLKDRAEDFARQTTDQVKEQVKDIGLMIAFAVAGGLMGLLTVIILLLALYSWVATTYGPPWGYAVVGGITAMTTAAMFIVAATRGKSRKSPIAMGKTADRRGEKVEREVESIVSSSEAAFPELEPVRPVSTSLSLGIPLAFGDLRRPLSGAIEEFLANTATTGAPIDSVINQVLHEASAASGQTIDMAANLIRQGPRKALFGVLAGSALLGWYLARKAGSPYSLEGLSSAAPGKGVKESVRH